MDASILIVTKDRCVELRRAVASALAQRGAAEVIVVDDGSTDGSGEMVEHEFPDVRLHRFQQSRGYIAQRNFGIRSARASAVVMIDDDAFFSSPSTVEQTIRDFDDPRVGAVAVPHIDVGTDDRPRLRAPADGVFATSEFTGTASAVRRDAFDAVGGFRESIFHQGEERDFCVRLLAQGFVVRVGRAEPIHHHPSARRDVLRMDLYGRRNTILYAWYNEPFPSAAIRIVESTAQGVLSGFRVRRPAAAVRGLLLGYRGCWQDRYERRPLERDVVRTFRRLWKHGPLPLVEIEPLLPRPSLEPR